ncbi:MAG: trigger factor [Nitrospirae bacterium]|nr:trigger factor [Nitrospirota bacterium]
MKIDMEEVSTTKMVFKIEVPSDLVSKEFTDAYDGLRKKVRVPGFRPGKAPLNILEQRYKKDVETDIIRRLVPDYYLKAVKESGVTPVEMPVIENIDLRKGGTLTFTATVEIKPKIERVVYEGIELKKEDIAVTDDDVTAGIEGLRERYAQLEVCEEDHPIEEDDYVQIDYAGFSGGKPVKDLRREGLLLQAGSGDIAPEIAKGLSGALKGEEREIKIDEKGLMFKVKVTEVKRKLLPELNDDFAKDVGECETLTELREKVKERILEDKREEQRANYRNGIIKKLIEWNPVEPPSSLVEQEIKGLLNRTKAFMGKKGDFEPEEEKAFREKYRSHAEEEVKGELLMTAIAGFEGITATDDDVEKEIERMAKKGQQDAVTLRRYLTSIDGGIENLKDKITRDKVVNLIMEKAKWV